MYKNPPIEVILSWPPPSLHPDSRVPIVLAVGIFFVAFLSLVVGLRILSRIFISKEFASDDWMTVFAYILTITTHIILLVNTRFGWGLHVWDVKRENVGIILKLIYAYAVVWTAANTAIKLSILLFYRRIFCLSSSTSHRFARLINYSLVGVLIWGVAFFFWASLVCHPLRAYWSLLPIKGQKCTDREGYISYGFLDISIDVYLLILPQYKIWTMRMEVRRKVAVATVMSFALLAIAASVMRLPFIFKTMRSYDTSWDGMELTLWSGAELTLSISCTCAPALRAFFTRKNSVLVGRLHTLQDRIEHSVRSVLGGGTGKNGGTSNGTSTAQTTGTGDEIERRKSDRTLVEIESEKASEKCTGNELDDLEWGKKIPPSITKKNIRIEE